MCWRIAALSLYFPAYRFFGVSPMASQSGNPVGPADIAKLLDLLNTSDANGENAGGPAVPGADTRSPDASSDPVTTSETSHSVDLSDNRQEVVENRFAAHIVTGMSKLKRT
jgi:hypothetical protein